MKKQNSLAEFFKSKSFYALLCVGALAIIAMSLVGLNQPSNTDDNNLVDLNEPSGVEYVIGEDEIDVVLDNNNPTSEDIANMPSDNSNEVAQSDEDGFYLGENLPKDVYENDSLVSGTEVPSEVVAEIPADSTEVSAVTEPVVEPVKTVMKTQTLYFDESSVLSGITMDDIVMKFEEQYHNNVLLHYEALAGIGVRADIGEGVKSTTRGKVVEVSTEGKYGNTVVVDIGNEYRLVYGHLDEVQVKLNDTIEVGQVIAKAGNSATIIGTKERDNHFYLSLEKGNDDVREVFNPMDYLADQE